MSSYQDLFPVEEALPEVVVEKRGRGRPRLPPELVLTAAEKQRRHRERMRLTRIVIAAALELKAAARSDLG